MTRLEDLPPDVVEAAQVLWDWHDPGDELRPGDVGIGLGSHDIGVATTAADLWHQGLFPLLVFTGANAPTTEDVFPRGEAIHYREHAISLGVPAEAILIETEARHTGENIANTRQLLGEQGFQPESVFIVTRPYHRRRAWATCRKLWPDVDITTAAETASFDDYVARVGDADFVIAWMVGEVDRIRAYPLNGQAVQQHVPSAIRLAFDRLASSGYLT